MSARRLKPRPGPRPSSDAASRRMRANRARDTSPELELRSALHARGLRFRVGQRIGGTRRSADVVFARARVAVFVDGCFWHGCPEHATWPKQNAEFWRQKIETNRLRDADTNSRLLEVGWTVLRFWEHESPIEATETVAQAVAMARAKHCTSPAGAHKKN